MFRFSFVAFGTFGLFATSPGVVLAQQLKYDLANEQQASYDYDIQVDTSDSLIKYSGIVNYKVTLANDRLVRLSFQGGLVEQTKPKANQGSLFGPQFPRPSILPSIFSRSNFAGKSQSKNSIGMSR